MRYPTAPTGYHGQIESISDEQLFRLLKKATAPKSKRLLLKKSLPADVLGHGGVHMPGDQPTRAIKQGAPSNPAAPKLDRSALLRRIQAAVVQGVISGHDGQVYERAVLAGKALPGRVIKLLGGVRV
ncbi:hypothetical protein [Gulbenkiania mobilis]|uniref:hypothetical protein n=1 Tax=Gulbenkiania mobilis TaxID=397457 RepID=UPI0006BBE57E|nr:hypothetical protein [Gulbenkiania mobilis]